MTTLTLLLVTILLSKFQGEIFFFSCFFLFQAVLRTQRALVDYRILFHFVNLEYTALLMYRSGSVRVTGDCYAADSRKLKFRCCSSPTFLRNDKALQCKVRTYDNFLIARILEQVYSVMSGLFFKFF